MEVNVLNVSGKETGAKVQLPESVFGIEPNDHAIYLDVKQFLANQRQGTHKSKQRNEIAGSTRKLYKQKVQAVPVRVVSNHHCLMVVAVYSVRNRAIIALN